MPRHTKPLTVAQLRRTLPPGKHFDGNGLFLFVTPSGLKSWRLKHYVNGKERQTVLGRYPAMPLAEAREAARAAREATKAGQGAKAVSAASLTLREAWEQFAAAEDWSPSTRRTAESRMDRHILPALGDRQLGSITNVDLLAALPTDKPETATRLYRRVKQVFIFHEHVPPVIAPQRLPKVRTTHRAALTDPRDVATLMWRIDEYGGQTTTVAALKLLALTFVRPGELRQAVWSEFDGDTWRIPAERMKMKKEHLVPLSKWAQQIVEALPMRNEYLFPAIGRRARPLSENTMNGALRGMGYSGDQMTAHGFRAMASTLLHEQGFPPEVIELQLAHSQKSQVAAAYNRSARLAERRKMMQAWADYLNGLMLERLIA